MKTFSTGLVSDGGGIVKVTELWWHFGKEWV